METINATRWWFPHHAHLSPQGIEVRALCCVVVFFAMVWHVFSSVHQHRFYGSCVFLLQPWLPFSWLINITVTTIAPSQCTMPPKTPQQSRVTPSPCGLAAQMPRRHGPNSACSTWDAKEGKESPNPNSACSVRCHLGRQGERLPIHVELLFIVARAKRSLSGTGRSGLSFLVARAERSPSGAGAQSPGQKWRTPRRQSSGNSQPTLYSTQ